MSSPLSRALPALVLTAATACAPEAAAPRTIIDVHVHAEPPGDPRFGQTVTHPVTGDIFTASADAEAHFAETLAVMQRMNVVKAVVSGRPHDAALRWRERAADKVLIGYAFDDPTSLDTAHLRREHGAGRLHVLGEIATQYEGVRPDDPRMEPIYALAEELDVPVALHMHPGPSGAPYPPHGMTQMRAANGSPLLLEDVLVRHQAMRIYVMHAGWPFLDETIALLHSHPQVYVDLGVIAWSNPRAELHRYLRGLVEAGYSRRVMFGSDQMVWPETIALAVRNVEAAPFLTEEQKQDIFCRNAARFLRLETATCE